MITLHNMKLFDNIKDLSRRKFIRDGSRLLAGLAGAGAFAGACARDEYGNPRSSLLSPDTGNGIDASLADKVNNEYLPRVAEITNRIEHGANVADSEISSVVEAIYQDVNGIAPMYDRNQGLAVPFINFFLILLLFGCWVLNNIEKALNGLVVSLPLTEYLDSRNYRQTKGRAVTPEPSGSVISPG